MSARSPHTPSYCKHKASGQAVVRIDGPGIAERDQVPNDPETMLRLTNTEVHAKVRCGKHKMGYSLFYGVWEFFYEKVVFFF